MAKDELDKELDRLCRSQGADCQHARHVADLSEILFSQGTSTA